MVLLLLHQFLNMHFSNPGLQVINVLRVLTTYVVLPTSHAARARRWNKAFSQDSCYLADACARRIAALHGKPEALTGWSEAWFPPCAQQCQKSHDCASMLPAILLGQWACFSFPPFSVLTFQFVKCMGDKAPTAFTVWSVQSMAPEAKKMAATKRCRRGIVLGSHLIISLLMYSTCYQI